MSSMPETPDEAEAGVTDAAEVEPAGTAEVAEPAPAVPDARLLEAHDLALEALREITPASSIGAPAGHRVEADGVVSLLFENTLRGYPGWYWTVSLAVVEGSEPTVLEAELLPGEDALLAPEWVPWAVRLKEYQAAQAAAAAEAAESRADEEVADDLDDDEDLDDELDDEEDDLDDELDEEDFDADASPILHSGDVDGVDIDELDDESDDEDDESDDEDEDSDDEDESDDDED